MAVVGIAIATLGLVITAFSPPATQIATGPQPCVNGVVPLNPYIINCNLPKRGNQVIGAAPDAGAIIACRHQPGMPVLVRELSRDSTSPRLSALIHRRAENPSDSVAHG